MGPKVLVASGIVKARTLAKRLLGVQTGPQYYDLEPRFKEHYVRTSRFTMTSVERMYGLYLAARHIARAPIPGDVVECGVWRGGSTMMAALTLLDEQDLRQLWLFDTFEGMPPPGEHDRTSSGQLAADRFEQESRWAYAPLGEVEANIARTGYPADRVTYVQGKVEDTIPGSAPDQIALLRLDTDWYESTRHELAHLWDRLNPGGVLIVDDYGKWEGARKAVDEFLAARGIRLLLTRLDSTGRMAIKLAP
jgi:hypothetical protein